MPLPDGFKLNDDNRAGLSKPSGPSEHGRQPDCCRNETEPDWRPPALEEQGHPIHDHLDGVGEMHLCSALDLSGVSLRLIQPPFHLCGTFGLGFRQPGAQRVFRFLVPRR